MRICFHAYMDFLLFLLLLKINLGPWWYDRMHGNILISLYLLGPVLWTIIWSILEKVPWGAEKKVYSICFISSFSFTGSLFSFCFQDLSIDHSGGVIVFHCYCVQCNVCFDLMKVLFCFCTFLWFCFMILDSLAFGAYMVRIKS
jgi:hypothetical protein